MSVLPFISQGFYGSAEPRSLLFVCGFSCFLTKEMKIRVANPQHNNEAKLAEARLEAAEKRHLNGYKNQYKKQQQQSQPGPVQCSSAMCNELSALAMICGWGLHFVYVVKSTPRFLLGVFGGIAYDCGCDAFCDENGRSCFSLQ